MKGRSEKTEIARPEKETTKKEKGAKKEKGGERVGVRAQRNAAPSRLVSKPAHARLASVCQFDAKL